MKQTIVCIASCLFVACRDGGGECSERAGASEDARSATASRAKLKTDEQKTLYALGLTLGRNLSMFRLTPDQHAFVLAGVMDQISGNRPEVDLALYAAKVSDLARSGQSAAVAIERERGRAYATKAAKEPGARVTPSGLIYIPVEDGHGSSPVSTDAVRVQYEGALVDGGVFDSSKEPVVLSLDRMMPCWSEGLPKMKVGGKATLVCPSNLGYGELTRPKIPGGSTLVFHIQLLGIESTKSRDSAPPLGVK